MASCLVSRTTFAFLQRRKRTRNDAEAGARSGGASALARRRRGSARARRPSPSPAQRPSLRTRKLPRTAADFLAPFSPALAPPLRPPRSWLPARRWDTGSGAGFLANAAPGLRARACKAPPRHDSTRKRRRIRPSVPLPSGAVITKQLIKRLPWVRLPARHVAAVTARARSRHRPGEAGDRRTAVPARREGRGGLTWPLPAAR